MQTKSDERKENGKMKRKDTGAYFFASKK